MLGLCCEVVKKTLQFSVRVAIGITKNRSNALGAQDAGCWGELLNANDCLRMLDRDEEQDIRKEKTNSEAKASTFARFVRDWRCANEAVGDQPADKAPRRMRGRGGRV